MGKSIWAFIVKYKLYHLIFWFLYHYFWWALRSGALEAVNNIFFSVYSTKFLFYVVMQALGVYFNLYYLVPKFLQTGKYLIYVPALLLTILLTSFGIIGGYYVNAAVVGIPFQELFQVAPSDFLQLFKSNALPSTLASMTLAMSIKLTKNWVASEKRRNEAEKENLSTELKFLRSQYNPHFLFNTINSIFVLIHKDQELASTSLAKFSDLLRYQLYQCNEPQIELAQEINYLKNYIELETLRQDLTNLDLQVSVDSSNTLGYLIAPFLLMPFVENAFKHVSHHDEQRNWISIDLKNKDKILEMKVSNSKPELAVRTTSESSGIGLNNVRRRLELLYPKSHVLEVFKTNHEYSISLQIALKTQLTENFKTA